MSAWVKLPQAAHRAAIAGKVVDGLDSDRAIEGVIVTISRAPAVAKSFVETHGDRAVTASDGIFHFADLPDGTYTLSFTLPGGGYGDVERDFTVARDSNGDIALAIEVISLPATGVRGTVQGRAPEGSPLGLSLARVRVRGSGERAYGDIDGRFLLAGLEPGPRVLELTASGYQPTTATAHVITGSIVEIAPIVLEPST